MVSTGEYEVVSLDFSLFTKGNEAEQVKFCADLKHSLSSIGFARLKYHLIPPDVVHEAFEWNRQFFGLSLEAKMTGAHPPVPNPHRGYSYVGQETLSRLKDFEKGRLNDEAVRDLKESYDQGSMYDEMFPNIWIDSQYLPGWRPFMEDFYERCQAMHLALLRALALSFGRPTDYFTNLCKDNNSELRMNHYPEITAEQLAEGTRRISEHTDFGTVTLLFQDNIGGLEVERQDGMGEYISVAPSERTEMLINIGDCLQRWTDKQLRSTSHRVTAPAVTSKTIFPDRYSIAYFGKPDREVSVATLPEFVQEGVPPFYTENMTALEYMQSKLLRTYPDGEAK